MYKADEVELASLRAQFEGNYPPFRPFRLTSGQREALIVRYENILQTQNGEGIDDYAINDDNNGCIGRTLVGYPVGSRVLILGTGTGREVLAAKDMGFVATGTTLGSRNVDYARTLLGLTETEIIECSHDVLPFPKETFDVVVGFQLFEHVLAPLLFLLEQSRVLKFGSKLILEWPAGKAHASGENPHHQICFVPAQAKDLFEKAGFGDIKVNYQGRSGPVPEEEMWRGDIDTRGYTVVEGVKQQRVHLFVRRSWDLSW